jgi:hypothetical protein
MRPTTTALALSGAAALALPTAADAAASTGHPPSPEQVILHARVGQVSVGTQMHAARRLQLTRRLTPKALRLARQIAQARGMHFDAKSERRKLRGKAPEALRRTIRTRRRELARAKSAGVRENGVAAGGSTASPTLQAIAACESGGNPSTNTGNGFYGKYQFTQSTWESVGGTGNPAAAPESEQDARAAALLARSGSSPWPVCGR